MCGKHVRFQDCEDRVQAKLCKGPLKVPNEAVRRIKRKESEKGRDKSSTNECSSPGVRRRHKSRDKKKTIKKRSDHHDRFVRHPSLEKVGGSDSCSSTTSLWTPVTESGFELPLDCYWQKLHPMSPDKKTMKQLNTEPSHEGEEPSRTHHGRYAREVNENGRPIRLHPRVRPRNAVLKGKKKKGKGKRGNVDTTVPLDSPVEGHGGSDDRSDAAEVLERPNDTLDGGREIQKQERSDLETLHRSQAKKKQKKRHKTKRKDVNSTKSDKHSKSKDKGKEKEVKNVSESASTLQTGQLSPRVHGRSELRKGGLHLTTNHIKTGEHSLKHWPEFQVNGSDICKIDQNENLKATANLAELASKPYAANFAFAIHRLEKTSIQFEKELNHTKHDLEYRMHKLKKKFYDYMDVTDDRLDEAERCQDVYYHEIKEDLAGIKRSLEQSTRSDATALMDQVKFEIDESMRKWYSKLESRTFCDSEGHGSSASSKSSVSGHRRRRRKKEKEEEEKKECDDLGDLGGEEQECHVSDEAKGSQSADQCKGGNSPRCPPQGNADDNPTTERPVHPGDGDSSSLQRWYEVKLKDVQHYWKAKSDEEHDLLKRRIKELEEMLFKETGFHNTLV